MANAVAPKHSESSSSPVPLMEPLPEPGSHGGAFTVPPRCTDIAHGSPLTGLNDNWLGDGSGDKDGGHEDPSNVEGLKPAPPELELAAAQKFTDENGAVIELETRGFLTQEGLLLRASDVATKLLDYDALNNSRAIFLRYSGVAGLGAELLGIPLDSALEVLSKCPLPCSEIYLLTIGTVGLLRSSMGILNENLPDDWLVVKVGKTRRGVGRRATEHNGVLGKIDKANLRFIKAIFDILQRFDWR
ncbi:hypothetical protein HDU88_000455 [Geranomyces variabilis]|nr:hypothetical protein HDU88_000455 [Geranomyces variabilis]